MNLVSRKVEQSGMTASAMGSGAKSLKEIEWFFGWDNVGM